MEIVINIPDKAYYVIQYFKSALDSNYEKDDDVKIALIKAVLNGTPLPKGHGRIGDLTAVMDDINQSINEMTNIGIAVDGEYLWEKLNDAIDNAPTIIEANKESDKE